MKLLHFSDAHIDMSNYGRHDPQSGLPLRVLDFLKALDTIVQAAIDQKVDLVLFAGDAYKDRQPAPTFQREWGKRIMRLSQAHIPTLLLVGNHDLSPAIGRAHAVQEFDTLQVPYVRVLDKPQFLGPDDLFGLPLQVIALPYIARSGLMAALGLSGIEPGKVYEQIQERLTELVHGWLEAADASLPVILTAHLSVEGAQYGSERSVMLGADLTLPGSLVRDRRLDYVALGHIHKGQNLNKDDHPPVIYPGSIERVDFGEANDDKFYVLAEVAKGSAQVTWVKLSGRPFIDRRVTLRSTENVTAVLQNALPAPEEMEGAIVRLTVDYPREWDTLIDEAALRRYTAGAFEFHLLKRPQSKARIRLPADQAVGSLSPLELLEKYWETAKVENRNDTEALQKLAREIIFEESQDS